MLEAAGHELILNEGTVPFTGVELEQLAPTVDAAIVGMDEWDAQLIGLATRVKILSKLGVGIDNIDGVAAREHGIDVTNAPGANANAVAELALGLMLAASRHIVAQDATVRAGGWDRITGTELTGKRVGLIGLGQTAQHLVRRLKGFEVSVLAYDPYADAEAAAKLDVTLSSIEEVMAQADFLSIHTPHTPATHHLISDEYLALMPSGSVLVNTSRGGVVDEDALYRALQTGTPAAAGIDVWEVEPVDPTHPLLTLSTVVATCHGAADTYEAYDQVGRVTAIAINDKLAGHQPKNIQNQEGNQG